MSDEVDPFDAGLVAQFDDLAIEYFGQGLHVAGRREGEGVDVAKSPQPQQHTQPQPAGAALKKAVQQQDRWVEGARQPFTLAGVPPQRVQHHGQGQEERFAQDQAQGEGDSHGRKAFVEELRVPVGRFVPGEGIAEGGRAQGGAEQ